MNDSGTPEPVDPPSQLPADPASVADDATLTGESPIESGGKPGLPAADQPVLQAGPETGFLQLDPRFRSAERISYYITAAAAVVASIVAGVFHILSEGLQSSFYWWPLGGCLVAVGLLLLSWFWPNLSFRHTHWRLESSGLEIHKGVLWRHRIIVPMSRVQHADVSQGPLQRYYGLGSLTVHTAGTSNASVELSGLNHAVALSVRDAIVRYRSDPSES